MLTEIIARLEAQLADVTARREGCERDAAGRCHRDDHAAYLLSLHARRAAIEELPRLIEREAELTARLGRLRAAQDRIAGHVDAGERAGTGLLATMRRMIGLR